MSATTVELAQLIDKIAPNSTVLDLRGYGLEALPENIGDITYLTKLNLNGNRLTSLPESIGNLTNLTELYLNGHKLTTLPESIGNLINLTRLDLNGDRLESLPESISNLTQLVKLNLNSNKFDRIPEAILSLPKLKKVNLNNNPLTDLSYLKHLPNLEVYRSNNVSRFTLLKRQNIFIVVISNLYLNDLILDLSSFTNIVCLRLYSSGLNRIRTNEEDATKYVKKMLDIFFSSSDKMLNLVLFHWDVCAYLYIGHHLKSISRFEVNFDTRSGFLQLEGNLLECLPESILNMSKLNYVNLNFNPLSDLSILNKLPSLTSVSFLGADLPRRYWTKLSEWKPDWLLDENNAEIRRMIIDRVGYEKICEVLNAIKIDAWREYVLLKIEDFQPVFERLTWSQKPVGKEPIVLLKMNCPSTGHIHILRVPPEMTSAEDAIVWVNHGIHPDRFTVQT